jgi:DNA (cytosine-5)-methyltransferase 1
MPGFYEFFCGAGMARAGLGDAWTCLLANDCDVRKAHSYTAHWGAAGLRIADVAALTTAEAPGRADLAWASFPCQDLSLAGAGQGLAGERSGVFWSFWRLMQGLAAEGRAPRLIALENVCGTLTSRQGADFAALCRALAEEGYRVGALVADAAHFLPQSRPRLFIVAAHADCPVPAAMLAEGPLPAWHPPALIRARHGWPEWLCTAWVWWRLPPPPLRTQSLADILEPDLAWHPDERTKTLLALMSPLHRAKVEAARQVGKPIIGTVYKRARSTGPHGRRATRAEIRLDGLAGCLRTPAGGSSRQTLMVIDGAQTRTRLLSPREAARLMGLADSYRLPRSYHQAHHLMGDGVAAPVVRFLARHLLEPLLNQLPQGNP